MDNIMVHICTHIETSWPGTTLAPLH